MTAPYDPATPLRADASDEEYHLRKEQLSISSIYSAMDAQWIAARELASAVSEEKDAKYREDTSALTAALREALRVVAEKDAEIAQLHERIAELEAAMRESIRRGQNFQRGLSAGANPKDADAF